MTRQKDHLLGDHGMQTSAAYLSAVGDQQAATRTVWRHALNPDDARLLLDALNLNEDGGNL